MIIEMLKTLYLVVIGIDISKSNEEDNYNIQKFSAKKVNVLNGRTDFLVTMIELLRFLTVPNCFTNHQKQQSH